MLDLTKDIELKKPHRRYYKILRLLVFAIFILGGAWLAFLILFPSQYFIFDFIHPNSSKNTIDNPSLSDNKLVFTASTHYDFSEIKVNIISNKKTPTLENSKISARKSYYSFFYPQGEDIEKLEDYSINSLVSSDGSVFIAGHKKKFPINNPATFTALGFDWNNVEPSDKIDLSQYEKQSLITIKSPHPEGTVFRTLESGRYFYIENEEKKELKKDALNNPDLLKKSVPVEEKILSAKEICQLKKTFFSSGQYHCLISLSNIRSFSGNDYQFELDRVEGTEIKKIELKFRRSLSWENLKMAFRDIGNKIFLRYGIY